MGRSAHTWPARWGRPASAVVAPAGRTLGLLLGTLRKAIAMSPMRLIRHPLAVTAVLTAALALGGASAASATTHAAYAAHVAQTEPVNLYLYVGDGNLVPQVEPTHIYTADGTIIEEQGAALPAPYGAAGTKYPGWFWSLYPTGASLGWASLNGTTVIQDVIGAGWAPLSAPYTGSYYYKCLEYLPNPLVNSDENWLRWDSANGEWVAMPLAAYGDYCENQ
jgi:hypothetical protein